MANTQVSTGQVSYAALIAAARRVLPNSYSPYSRFPVAAAVLMQDGNIVTGVNIENVSYGLTICAERAAIFRAISEGKRSVRAIAVIAGNGKPCPPCGACRQVIYEFADLNTEVVFEGENGQPIVKSIADFLPDAFGPSNLKPYI